MFFSNLQETTKPKILPRGQYFILTSEEAYAYKVKARLDKEERERKKLAKKEQKQKKL